MIDTSVIETWRQVNGIELASTCILRQQQQIQALQALLTDSRKRCLELQIKLDKLSQENES